MWGAAKVEPNGPRDCWRVHLCSVLHVGAGLLQVHLAAARVPGELAARSATPGGANEAGCQRRDRSGHGLVKSLGGQGRSLGCGCHDGGLERRSRKRGDHEEKLPGAIGSGYWIQSCCCGA